MKNSPSASGERDRQPSTGLKQVLNSGRETEVTPLSFAEARIPIIPVCLTPGNGRYRKQPMIKWNLATTNQRTITAWWREWPAAVPGIPLARMGWAVVDADGADGVAAVAEVIERERCLGPHSKIATPSGGLHLVFAQPSPAITKLRWSDAVEILGTSCLLTAYDLEELLFPKVAPRAVLPEVFRRAREDGLGDGPNQRPIINSSKKAPSADVMVEDCTAALRQLDPRDWGKGHYERWFALMTAAKHVGITEEDFVDWCARDVDYAADRRQVSKMWRRLRPQHGGAFWAALSAAGIKQPRHNQSSLYTRSHVGAKAGDWRHRVRGVLAKLQAEPSEYWLFWSAKVMGEVMAEAGKPKPAIAVELLETVCKSNGLWRGLGSAECRRQIVNGLRYVECKLLEGKQ
jgi:hypothetical protein